MVRYNDSGAPWYFWYERFQNVYRLIEYHDSGAHSWLVVACFLVGFHCIAIGNDVKIEERYEMTVLEIVYNKLLFIIIRGYELDQGVVLKRSDKPVGKIILTGLIPFVLWIGYNKDLHCCFQFNSGVSRLYNLFNRLYKVKYVT